MMRKFFDHRQLLHAPTRELHNGGFTDYAETPARAEAILAAIGGAEAPEDRGEGPILAVHDADYIAFLKSAAARWAEAGRPGDVVGYVWPVVGRRPLKLDRIDAQIGQYSFDASTPITPQTWKSAYWSAQSALAATQAVLDGERSAFALCRPPGHHAGADYYGGYCHLNAAAIAAQAARDAGKRRVAILDIDYHHGNGTQDIFWSRGDVFYASLHADPATDYPFYWGHGDEVGAGEGLGATLNLPLPQGTTLDAFRGAQARALQAIADFGAELLVVSFGADTYLGDPISAFRIETPDYALLAQDIAAAGLPTVIVMEGGYAVDALGENVASLLSGW
jgi:acetoin utilization deacetylase AcuC-like enzyme